jgi:hypothetical protein
MENIEMAGPEKRVEAGFAKWCRAQGIFCLKLAAHGVTGFPDRSIILPGGTLACVEFKSPTGKTSKVQDQRIAALRALGVPVLVTSDKKEAIEWLLNIMNQSRTSCGPHTSTKGRQSSSCTKGQV